MIKVVFLSKLLDITINKKILIIGIYNLYPIITLFTMLKEFERELFINLNLVKIL